jgi:hydroxymethylbilane synthase
MRSISGYGQLPALTGLALRGHGVQSIGQSWRSPRVLRIGTRGSPLALAQANEVRDLLIARHGPAPDNIALEIIRTTGDVIVDRPLAEAGGKGLFTKEIDEALLAGKVDLAVHSAKDLPTMLPEGLMIAAVPPREDARDVFISRIAASVSALPIGAVVGTASLRRQALVKRMRPDLAVRNFRGNVETRLRKIEAGAVDATLLALAGLKRLGMTQAATAILEIDEFLPAVGQGIIAIVARADDDAVVTLVAGINDAASQSALLAERAFLDVLDGSCRTPIAGHARVLTGRLHFRGLLAKPDGSQLFDIERAGTAGDALRIGADAGRALKAQAGAGFFNYR